MKNLIKAWLIFFCWVVGVLGYISLGIIYPIFFIIPSGIIIIIMFLWFIADMVDSIRVHLDKKDAIRRSMT